MLFLNSKNVLLLLSTNSDVDAKNGNAVAAILLYRVDGANFSVWKRLKLHKIICILSLGCVFIQKRCLYLLQAAPEPGIGRSLAVLGTDGSSLLKYVTNWTIRLTIRLWWFNEGYLPGLGNNEKVSMGIMRVLNPMLNHPLEVRSWS